MESRHGGDGELIVVTVAVPIMDISYDFQIDEDVPFKIVRNELADMISRDNKCSIEGDVHELMIWDRRRNVLLDMERTGYENGLETGSELVMA